MGQESFSGCPRGTDICSSALLASEITSILFVSLLAFFCWFWWWFFFSKLKVWFSNLACIVISDYTACEVKNKLADVKIYKPW